MVTGFLPSPLFRSSLSSPPSQVSLYSKQTTLGDSIRDPTNDPQTLGWSPTSFAFEFGSLKHHHPPKSSRLLEAPSFVESLAALGLGCPGDLRDALKTLGWASPYAMEDEDLMEALGLEERCWSLQDMLKRSVLTKWCCYVCWRKGSSTLV